VQEPKGLPVIAEVNNEDSASEYDDEGVPDQTIQSFAKTVSMSDEEINLDDVEADEDDDDDDEMDDEVDDDDVLVESDDLGRRNVHAAQKKKRAMVQTVQPAKAKRGAAPTGKLKQVSVRAPTKKTYDPTTCGMCSVLIFNIDEY
jgi:hypothetical protein